MYYEPNIFRSIGVETMRRDKKVEQTTEDRRFHATFGTSPEICSILWEMCNPHDTMPKGVLPNHLLWALMFMKIYSSESVLSTMANCVDEKTFRKWVWKFIDKISDLQAYVILWENRFRGDRGNDCLVSVDGTDFRIRQLKPFWKGWFSHKFSGPGLRYEVGVSILCGDIVWINGPFPCGAWPDIKIFRKAMIHELEYGERAEADNGYRGEPRKIKTPNDFGNEAATKLKKRVQARHETVNKRFKQWECLKQVFHHDIRKHSVIFCAVAAITQLSIENGEPLFDVDYNDENL